VAALLETLGEPWHDGSLRIWDLGPAELRSIEYHSMVEQRKAPKGAQKRARGRGENNR
jgi:hypothetical protein